MPPLPFPSIPRLVKPPSLWDLVWEHQVMVPLLPLRIDALHRRRWKEAVIRRGLLWAPYLDPELGLSQIL